MVHSSSRYFSLSACVLVLRGDVTHVSVINLHGEVGWGACALGPEHGFAKIGV